MDRLGQQAWVGNGDGDGMADVVRCGVDIY